MEVEDDVFFADLNRRISLLIMDDDEDSVVRYPSVSVQAFTMMGIHPSVQVQSSQFAHVQNGSNRRECKGTGVFIPQSSHPRRKNRQGRILSSSSNTKNSSRSDLLPQPTTYNLPSNNINDNINNNNNSYYCYNSFGKNRY